MAPPRKSLSVRQLLSSSFRPGASDAALEAKDEARRERVRGFRAHLLAELKGGCAEFVAANHVLAERTGAGASLYPRARATIEAAAASTAADLAMRAPMSAKEREALRTQARGTLGEVAEELPKEAASPGGEHVVPAWPARFSARAIAGGPSSGPRNGPLSGEAPRSSGARLAPAWAPAPGIAQGQSGGSAPTG